jgi:hypothetical protein
MNASAWKKAIFFFCCLCCILAILGQADFVFSHINHECKGSGCPVCIQIQETIKLLRFLGLSFICVLAAAALNHAAAYRPLRINATSPPFTGITLKVRFNA